MNKKTSSHLVILDVLNSFYSSSFLAFPFIIIILNLTLFDCLPIPQALVFTMAVPTNKKATRISIGQILALSQKLESSLQLASKMFLFGKGGGGVNSQGNHF